MNQSGTNSARFLSPARRVVVRNAPWTNPYVNLSSPHTSAFFVCTVAPGLGLETVIATRAVPVSAVGRGTRCVSYAPCKTPISLSQQPFKLSFRDEPPFGPKASGGSETWIRRELSIVLSADLPGTGSVRRIDRITLIVQLF